MALFSHLGMREPRARRSAFFREGAPRETLTRDYGEIAQSNTNE